MSSADSSAADLNAVGEPTTGAGFLFGASGGVSTFAAMLFSSLTGVAACCMFSFKSCKFSSSFVAELLRRTGLTGGTRFWGAPISFSDVDAFPLA